MKKIKSFFSLGILVSLTLIFTKSSVRAEGDYPPVGVNYSIETVYTPNNTAVEVGRANKEAHSNWFIDWHNTDYEEQFTGITRISSATAYYNCHAYAWCSQNMRTQVWMNDPTAFYTDGSYIEVSTPQAGDRICYFAYTYNSSINDFEWENIHSGLVYQVLSGDSNGLCGNSDLVMVESKWGCRPLYHHNGFVCPYTSYLSSTSNPATIVRYYRLPHTHSYVFQNIDSSYHRCTCECGDTFLQQHHWHSIKLYPGYRYLPAWECNECGRISYIDPSEN